MKSRAMGTSIGTEHSKNKSVNANTQSVPATECRTNNNNNVRIQQGNKVRTTFRSLRDPSSQVYWGVNLITAVQRTRVNISGLAPAAGSLQTHWKSLFAAVGQAVHGFAIARSGPVVGGSASHVRSRFQFSRYTRPL